jgi:hypothetical protein
MLKMIGERVTPDNEQAKENDNGNEGQDQRDPISDSQSPQWIIQPMGRASPSFRHKIDSSFIVSGAVRIHRVGQSKTSKECLYGRGLAHGGMTRMLSQRR